MRGLSSKPYRTGAIGGIPRSRERGVALLVMALLMVIGLPIMGLMKGMEHRHNPAVIQHSLGYQLLVFPALRSGLYYYSLSHKNLRQFNGKEINTKS